jgi:hypothetical protein
MRLLIAGICLLFGASFFLKSHPGLGLYAGLAQGFFLPWLSFFFLAVAWMNPLFYKRLELPPIQVFILSMVIKMMLGLGLLLVYLIQGLGPKNEGAWTFMSVYIILEFLEIIRFLSILRPDSRR